MQFRTPVAQFEDGDLIELEGPIVRRGSLSSPKMLDKGDAAPIFSPPPLNADTLFQKCHPAHRSHHVRAIKSETLHPLEQC